MEYVTLPNSDLSVSKLCVGCWQFNQGYDKDVTWSPQPEQVSKEIVDKAIELGINFFDTAEGYKNSEQVLGNILRGRRKNVVVATKLGTRVDDYTPEDVEKSLVGSLERLQTDYIDLYQIHWPVYIAKNWDGCIQELKRQQAKGRIRHIGVCNFGPNNLNEILASGLQPVTNQLSYNLLWRAVEYDLLPLCKEHNIGILPYSPLQQGLLSGKYLTMEDVPEGRRRTRLFNVNSTSMSRHGGEGAEKQMFQAISDIKATCDQAGLSMPQVALSWLLQQQPVMSVITGASSPQQVEKNVQLAHLEQDLVKKLSDATEELKSIFGNNPDMWAKEARMK